MISINANSLKWAYKKLKNYIYYSSPYSYLKDKLIAFEENYNENTFDNMAKDLLAMFSNKHAMVSWQGISYTIYPKKDGITSFNDKLIVENFNVFIDMPLKFFLVDILFTLNIFENLDYNASSYSFGNDFDKRLWQIKEGITEGNILENNLLFANFNSQYDLWKEKIFNVLEEAVDEDKIIVKMDLKKSYYNVYFNINDFIKNHLKEETLNNPIYEFEKQLYYYYSSLLNNIIQRKMDTKRGFVHLPIGLFSSACIFNILLKDFDEIILNNSISYSRYVDDILIVLPQETKNDLNDIFKRFFPNLFIKEDYDNEYKVNEVLDKYGRYIINKNKIKVLSYKAGFPIINLKTKLNKIIKPSLDIIEEMDFDDDNLDEYFLFKHDYLKGIVNRIKSRSDEKYDFIKKLSDSEIVNIYSCWKTLISFDTSDEENSNYFKNRIEQAINRTFLKSNQTEFNDKLRKALYLELDFASNCSKYRKYLLCDIKQARTFEHIEKLNENEDDFFYPLTTTFDEITLYLSQKQDFIEDDFIYNAERLYEKINGLTINKTCIISKDSDNIYNLTTDNFVEENHDKIRIAVANMNLLLEDLEETDIRGIFPPTYDLVEFKHIIDLAKNQNAEIILFPEFALPEKYALDIVKHCRKRNMSIITGLTHRGVSGDLINQVLIRDKDLDIALFKWKNYLPLTEKKLCLKNKYGYRVPQIPYYLVINNGKYKYSTMTCFEATSLKDRALLCDEIDVLYVPVFNSDTFYFSNIISSFVRDSSCFVAQANSNQYGDSRISGPYGQVFLDVVKLKGGLNNYFVVGEIDLDGLRNKNIKGEELESCMDTNACTFSPSWDEILDNCFTNYKKLNTKPISAGHERYKNRKKNGLDKI